MGEVKEFFLNIWEYVKDKAWILGEALITLVVSFLLYWVIISILKVILKKSKMPKITQKFVVNLIRVALIVIIIIIVLSKLGVATTGLIALLSAAGLAVSLALQGSLSNLANGIVVVSTRPFEEGDYVSIGGVEGSVKEIHLLTTHLITTDGKVNIMPNSKVVTDTVVNYNTTGKRRVDFSFFVAHESDVNKVKTIILDVMASDARVYKTPNISVNLKKVNENGLEFFACCWCDSGDYWDVYYYITATVFNQLKKEEIRIPLTQYEVKMVDNQIKMPYDEVDLTNKNKELQEEKTIDNRFEKIVHKFKK